MRKENFWEKIFENVGIPSRGCPLFRKFWKMLFHSLLEVAENSNLGKAMLLLQGRISPPPPPPKKNIYIYVFMCNWPC